MQASEFVARVLEQEKESGRVAPSGQKQSQRAVLRRAPACFEALYDIRARGQQGLVAREPWFPGKLRFLKEQRYRPGVAYLYGRPALVPRDV